MDALRQNLLDHNGHALVTGGPGSGKTTLALQKALKRIQEGLSSGQSVLFLSFSRAAVARIVDASKLSIPRDKRDQLTIQTFHGFFWELLRTHAYLLGTQKRLAILMPHDERSLSAGAGEGDLLWPAWLEERERLFREEGRIPFDFFAPRAAELIQRSALIRNLITEKHPLIIVDEAQDTNPDAWRCIEMLSTYTQIVCLADLEQQIFDHLPGIGPERIEAIKNALNPLPIELGMQNHRSPNSEIVVFARNILAGSVRRDPYRGVSALGYDAHPKRVQIAKVVRSANAILQRKIEAETGKRGKRVAILLPSGAAAARLSAALNSAEKPLRHKLLFDEAEAMLAARFAAFFLEPAHTGTIHKSKGKQFDGVIIVREPRHDGEKFVSSLVWRNDTPPYARSRKILHVAITRAQTHVLILNPAFPKCPILSGHRL